MSLSVLQRPKGVAIGTGVTSVIEQDYIGYATVKTTLPHNLATNDWVYIVSVVENYNGFWQIHFIDGYHYFLLNPDGTYVAYIVDTSITYYPQSFTHGWSCVELPIMYQLKNTRFPTNSEDTARTVSSFSNSNGYVQLTLSGSLGTFEDLSFVKITGTSLLDDVYQILDKWSSSSIVINLAYASSLSFSGGTVQLYYSNYHVSVKLYAGLNSSHTWQAVKPYELAATLEFIPDSNNKVTFSVNEILMFYIEQRNNLLLATLPNNLDFWTQFYISYSESYDTSDGYTITTHQDSYTSDQSTFEGYAANSKLEFKNIYSGYLTQYVMNSATAKFLTLFATPVLFAGCTQDISFLYTPIDKYNVVADATNWLNSNKGYEDWTPSTASVSITSPNSFTEVLYKPNTLIEGVTYNFSWNVSGLGSYTASGGNALSVIFGFYNSSLTLISSVGLLSATGSTKTTASSGTILVPANATYVGFQVTSAGLTGGSYIVQILSFKMVSNQVHIQTKKYSNGTLLATTNTNLGNQGEGIYRHQLAFESQYDQYKIGVNGATSDTGLLGEELTINLDNTCTNQNILLGWLNNLGGFDYWNFTAFSEYIRNITDSGTTSTDPFANWPKSYGADANTLTKQSYRDSQKQILVRSQHVTQAQMDAIMFIKSSVLVEIVNSRMDKRRVILDTDSFTAYKDNDKLYNISFTISYTDDIPSQRI